MIYLDNAATTYPKPPAVRAAVADALRRYSANPGRGGHTPSIRTAEAVFHARGNLAGFFGLSEEANVVFTNNCTAALNTVIKGVLRQGDHAVISSLEHNSVLRPLEALREKGVVTYTVAPVGDTPEQTIDAFRGAINRNTRLFICTHASNVFGVVLPVRQLCALAHSYGILFCLDAAQSAGVLPIDLQEDGYDFVCCAGHKGLYGPMGTGVLLARSAEGVLPLTEGGTGSESADPRMPSYLPDRLESGTLNVPGILGLSSGVSFVREQGIGRVCQKELSHIRLLHEAFSRMDRVRLYTPHPDEALCAPVLSFSVEGADSESVAAYLNRQYGVAVRAGLHCAPLAHRSFGTEESGTVRVSPSVFTTRQEMQILVNALNKFVHLS